MSNMIPWDTDSTSFNGVTRLRASLFNFLANGDFESWNNGTNVAPPGWTGTGGVTISQQPALTIGSYCTQLVFDATNTGVFYQAVGSSTAVDYTFTCYVKRISGTGTANLVARRDDSPFTSYATCALNTTGGTGLAALTVKPAAGTSLRFSIEASSAAASTWQIDECMFQESKSVATAYVRGFIDDSTSQSIFGTKLFSLQRTYNQGMKLYDSTNTWDVTLAPAAATGNVTLTLPTTTDTLVGNTSLTSRSLIPTATKTANYTAVAGDFVMVDATSGPITITAPTLAPGVRWGIRLTTAVANAVTASTGSGTFDTNGLTTLGFASGTGTALIDTTWAGNSAGTQWVGTSSGKPNSYLSTLFLGKRSVNVISANTTLAAATNTDYVYKMSGSTGNTTLTMPTAVGNTNRYTIYYADFYTNTIITTLGQTIDKQSSYIQTNNNTSIDLVSDNANWIVI